jgi:hypothetical protein
MAFTAGTTSIRIKNVDRIVINYTLLDDGTTGFFTNDGENLEQGVALNTTPNTKFTNAKGSEVVSSEKVSLTYTLLGSRITDLNVYNWLKLNTTRQCTIEVYLDDNTFFEFDGYINSTRVAKTNDLFKVNVTIEKNCNNSDDVITWANVPSES